MVSHAMHVVLSHVAALLTVAHDMHDPTGTLGTVSAGSVDVRMVFPTHWHPKPSAETDSPLGHATHVSVCTRKYSPDVVHTVRACDVPNLVQSPSTFLDGWGGGSADCTRATTLLRRD